MTNYGPYHHIYDLDGGLILTFTSAVWYDTATPAQWCIKRLQELHARLPDKPFKIESDDAWITIETVEQFIAWIDDDFCVDAPSSFSGIFLPDNS